MVDTVRTTSALRTLLADNTAGNISAQDLRDVLVSCKGGHGYYPDLATIATPLAIVAGVRKQFVSDGLGIEGDTNHLPYPKTQVTDELWDTTTNRIDLANLVDGETLTARVTFTITPGSPNMELDFFLRAYNSGGGFEFEQDHSLAEVKLAVAHAETVELSFFIAGNILDGTVLFEFETSKNADVTIGGIDIVVMR